MFQVNNKLINFFNIRDKYFKEDKSKKKRNFTPFK